MMNAETGLTTAVGITMGTLPPLAKTFSMRQYPTVFSSGNVCRC
jgi:hypothetical protein